jgi:hypothetical protein
MWAATLALGIALGLATRACLCIGGGKGLWWAAALVGLAGAAIGRVTIDVAILNWHSPLMGGVFGSLFLSLLWSAIMRLGAPQTGR